MAPLITRFAPSPTGYLHLGHVVSALYVWGIGRALGAKILLRIEDHDRSRSRAAYEDAIHADLAWLGFQADATYRQSDARAEHDAALVRLALVARVYGCDCSRKTIAASMPDAARADELHYDGTCRTRGLGWRQGEAHGVRVELPSRIEHTRDLLLGDLQQNPAEQCGDLLLRDRQGNYTYQHAVVADDLREGVNLVIRGQDLTASTGRQIALARLLGRDEPIHFAHHPLVVDGDGRKLGKRFLSEGVATRRAAGEDGAAVLGEAAFVAGLIPAIRPVAVDECKEWFRHVRI